MRSPKSADTIALEALGFIAGEEAELSRFLRLSGLTPDRLRQTAGTSQTLQAVMRYLLGHEPTARAFAENNGYQPEDLARAAHDLGAAP